MKHWWKAHERQIPMTTSLSGVLLCAINIFQLYFDDIFPKRGAVIEIGYINKEFLSHSAAFATHKIFRFIEGI